MGKKEPRLFFFKWVNSLFYSVLIFRNDMLCIFNGLSSQYIQLLRCFLKAPVCPRAVVMTGVGLHPSPPIHFGTVIIARTILLIHEPKVLSTHHLPFFMLKFQTLGRYISKQTLLHLTLNITYTSQAIHFYPL